MRHTLQGIDSRITGKRISQLKDRMMEITATEQNKENNKKKKKEMRTVSNNSLTTVNVATFVLQ